MEGIFGDSQTVEDADDQLHYIGIGFLILFQCEVILVLFAYGLSFFRHVGNITSLLPFASISNFVAFVPGFIIDFVIIPLSLILEFLDVGLGGFLIIAR